MTLHNMMASDVSGVFLNQDDFAVAIRRVVDGECGSQVVGTGIITWFNTEPDFDRGRGNVRRGELMLSSSFTVTVKDSFFVGADRVEVQTVGPIQDGARMCGVIQYIPETKGGRPIRSGDI